MTDDLIHQPHDKFFKNSFADVTVVREHLRAFLPKEISDKIDFESLVQDDTNYISEALQAHYADVVWNVNYGRTGIKIALLYEHKSMPDKYVLVQLLRYILQIWDEKISRDEDLVLVIPIVVYQGVQEWEHQRFEHLFPDIDGVLLRYLPVFDYERTDTTEVTERILTQNRAYKTLLVFQVMRQVITRNLGADALILLLDSVVNAQDFGQANDMFSKAILSYAFNYSNEKPLDIIEKIRLSASSKQENYMSTLNQFYTEGISLGKAEGISLGKAEGKTEGLLLTAKIIKLYARGFGAVAIAEKLETELETVNTAIAEYEAAE
jgi:predicted transposase/invertase (TIGR01784 family)